MIFGELILNNEKYHFQFEDYELQIHRCETENSDYENIEDLFSFKTIKVPDTLLGTCYPDNHKILFMQISHTGMTNNVKKFTVRSYFEIKSAFSFPQPISQITICAEELNNIYPPSLMYSQTRSKDGGITAINIQRPRQSYSWEFSLDNQKITVSSGFFHTYKWGSTPVQIQSALYFSFDPTDNYEFVVHLFDILHRLLQYLCYRQNIHCTGTNIYALDEDNRQISIGVFSAKWISELQPESSIRILEKVISFDLIGDSLSNILQRLADHTLYFLHLPDNSLDERRITPARSIMLAAAFEWEYSQIYLGGSTKNKGSFYDRLVRAFTDYADCIEIFAKYKYSLNKKSYAIDSTARKITKARNNFAHGDISMEYDLETLLGISLMPYLVYAMQLRAAGINTRNIRNAINKLFDLRISV